MCETRHRHKQKRDQEQKALHQAFHSINIQGDIWFACSGIVLSV
jgi:hypothetical protein